MNPARERGELASATSPSVAGGLLAPVSSPVPASSPVPGRLPGSMTSVMPVFPPSRLSSDLWIQPVLLPTLTFTQLPRRSTTVTFVPLGVPPTFL